MTADAQTPFLPQMELPLWLRRQGRHNNPFSGGRARMMLVAAACVLMGYILTASLGGPSFQQELYQVDVTETATVGDVLEGPAGFSGLHESVGANSAKQSDREEKVRGGQQNPSIKGALSDLHRAVGGKISGLASSLRLPASLTAGSGGGARHNVSRPGIFSDYEPYNDSSSASPSRTAGGAAPGQGVSEQLLSPGRDLLGARQRVGKVTIIFGGAAIYERAVRTHEAHDAVHGYPLHVLRHGIMDDVWSKPAYMLSLLLRELSRPEGERLQWLLWVDADTILLNPYVPVEVFLPPSPEFDDVHMLVTRDWNGLNNGVFPVRVNQWAVDLFAAIVSYRYYRPDAPLVFRDQSAMDALLKEPRFAAHTAWAPQRWFNAYQGEHNETLAPFQVRRGDFLVHFAGVGDRTERMTYWLDRVEQHLPDWEIEVQHTSYPSEAREFWSQQRQARADAARALAEQKGNATELTRLTEEQLAEYQSRLGDGDVRQIREKVQKLKETLGRGDVQKEQIDKAMEALNAVRGPLDGVTKDASKALLKEAHETIFAAEKLLLKASDKTAADVVAFEEATVRLKSLVLQASWTKADLSRAIDEVRRLKAGLEQRQQQQEEAQAARVAGAAAALTSVPDGVLHAAETADEERKLVPAAEKAKKIDEPVGEPLLSEVAPAMLEPPEGMVYVTHTATAMEMTTHMVMVMETVTVQPDAAKR